MTKEQIQFLKNNISKYVQIKEKVQTPQPQGGFLEEEKTHMVHIDMEKWVKSYEQNPDPNQLYTMQVSSTKELMERATGLCGKLDSAQDSSDLATQDCYLDKLSKRLE